MIPEPTSNIFAQLFQPKPPLQIHSVLKRGIPNEECVYIRVNSRTYLGDYFLHAGLALHPSIRAIPLPNISLWLGEDTIDAGAWVIVYTGPGEPKLVTQIRETKEHAIVLHWHLGQTIFTNTNIVPLLVKIDRASVQIGEATVTS